jgi:microcystin-dependent protein
MGTPYVGEIRMFAGNFAPVGWMLCQGQLIPISENDTMFNLIGTTYGGDGQQTFALPDLQGRVPVHQGTNQGFSLVLAEKTGVEAVTLNTNQVPQHSHALQATSTTPVLSPANAIPAVASSSTQPGVMVYGASTGAGTTLQANTIQPAGSSQPHDNMQPFLCINFIIATQGVFPSQT